MYYDYSEPVAKIPSHRVLAINRGEKEGFLRVSVEVDEQRAINAIQPVSYPHLIFTRCLSGPVFTRCRIRWSYVQNMNRHYKIISRKEREVLFGFVLLFIR